MSNIERRNKMMHEIEKVLNEENFYFSDFCSFHDLPVVGVLIERGDWKHDHLRCDLILKDKGFVLMSEHVTFNDGSDVYSSIHYFSK